MCSDFARTDRRDDIRLDSARASCAANVAASNVRQMCSDSARTDRRDDNASILLALLARQTLASRLATWWRNGTRRDGDLATVLRSLVRYVSDAIDSRELITFRI